MKGAVVAIDNWQGRSAAALMVDGVLEDVVVDPCPEAPPAPGTVFRAVPDRPMKGIGGMFVRLPDGQRGFLRQIKGVSPGRPLPVQVTSYAEPGKAVPVTARLTFKSRLVIVTPGAPGRNLSRQIKGADARSRLEALLASLDADPGNGLILRSAAADAADAAILADIDATCAAATGVLAAGDGTAPALLHAGPDPRALARRDWPATANWDDDAGAFARNGVLDALDAALNAELPLAGGGSAWIEPTRALVAVDVNSGGDSTPAAGLKTNIALARALPRALRCRGLGGQIAIDVAPMPKQQRRSFENALAAAFRADPVETTLVGWTPLGHFELQRHRVRWPIHGSR